MALVSKNIPNLINGVSQQPPALRLPTQGEAQENGLSDVVDGLKKRPPTKFLNKLVKVSSSWTAGSALTSSNTETFTSLADYYITTYKRSQTEQYTVVIEPSATPIIYVYDIDGNLNYQSGKASWKGDGTWVVDNTDSTAYLAGITKEGMTSTSVADATFIVNKSKIIQKKNQRIPAKNDPSALVFLKSVNYSRAYTLKVTSKEGGGYVDALAESQVGSSTNPNDETQLKTSTITNGLKADFYTASNFIGNTGNSGSSTGVIAQQYEPPYQDNTYSFVSKITLDAAVQGGATDGSDLLVTIGGNTIFYEADNINGWKWDVNYSSIELPSSVITTHEVDTDDGDDTETEYRRGSVSITKIVAGQDVSSGYKVAVTPTGFTSEPYFVLTSNPNSTFGDFDVTATDDDGGTNLRVFKGVVKSFTDLPSSCIDGYQLQVAGDNNKKEDNFYVKFEGGSGGGYWKETVGDGLKNDFDLTTMPHTLKQKIDSSGNLYFTFTQGKDNDGEAWQSRKAGDDDTNPFPSFIDNTINDIFFHRNRLGIISGENVIFSETSNFFNFFRTTVRGLLDSDPIDVAVSQNQVSELKAALPIQDSLLLFSELNQFTLSSSQLLTPSEVTIDQSTKFECDLRTAPVGAGNSVFFSTIGGNYAGVREYYTDGETEIKDATLITAHVPEYILGNIRKMAASTNEDMLVCLTSSVKSEAYVYKWYNSSNERLQSSWSKWKFDKNVADVTFNNSDLYVTFEDGSFEKMTLRTATQNVTFSDEGTLVTFEAKIREILLDHSVKVQASTTGAAPYTSADFDNASAIYGWGDTTQFVTYRGEILGTGATLTKDEVIAAINGQSHTENSTNVGSYVYAGEPYTFKYQVSEQVFTPSQGDATQLGRFQLRNIAFNFNDTGTFNVAVEATGRDVVNHRFTGRLLGQINNLLGYSAVVDNDTFKVGIQSQASETAITITNDTHLPCVFQSAEYEAWATLRNRRL